MRRKKRMWAKDNVGDKRCVWANRDEHNKISRFRVARGLRAVLSLWSALHGCACVGCVYMGCACVRCVPLTWRDSGKVTERKMPRPSPATPVARKVQYLTRGTMSEQRFFVSTARVINSSESTHRCWSNLNTSSIGAGTALPVENTKRL